MILAGAAPFPLLGKLIAAMVMLALTGGLTLNNARRPSERSIVLAVIVCFAAVVVLEIALPNYFFGFHELGLLAGFVGILCGFIFLCPVQHLPEFRRVSRASGLFTIALLIGPLLGLLVAVLTVSLTEVSPLDVDYTYSSFVMIGAVASVIGAPIVAISALNFGTDRS